jgi:RNA polymerase sigma-70 factor, ECF subfamily
MTVSKETDIEKVVQTPEKENRETDGELIRLFLEGSEEAFNRLVLAHQQKAYNIAFRFLGNHEDANEIAQDAFVSVYRNLRAFRGHSSFQTWLYTIIMNLARNRYRKMKRRKEDRRISLDAPLRTDESDAAREVPDTSLSPDRGLYGKEIQQKLQDALEMIEPEHRQVVVLRHIECLSYEEIAQILGCAEGTIKSRLHRARQELRQHLGGLI